MSAAAGQGWETLCLLQQYLRAGLALSVGTQDNPLLSIRTRERGAPRTGQNSLQAQPEQARCHHQGQSAVCADERVGERRGRGRGGAPELIFDILLQSKKRGFVLAGPCIPSTIEECLATM
ncbi:hypothetical protein NDU88_002897 [Pleurodeles waltl]|uniref:Uncharacterized protein n=1 Tax=Pleurodeles waltl TaxID=8319 RepID=A0AAV7M4P9_PLEWA|nr:hypothetical protein NDU88_002897 [Pleurodeles waltl]